METMKVMLEDGAFMPERAHPTDAGLDLRTRHPWSIAPGGRAKFDTGVHIQLPKGMYGKIESKSGLNVKQGVVSCGGVIDEGYTGSIVVELYNLGEKIVVFEAGDKIAQLVIQPYKTPSMKRVSKLDESERGDAGFGSTGR